LMDALRNSLKKKGAAARAVTKRPSKTRRRA